MAKNLKAPAPAAASTTWGGEVATVDDLPSIGARQTRSNAAPTGQPDEPWYWVAGPHSWQVLAGRVVPSLRKIILHRGGGMNNVDTVKVGGKRMADPTYALTLAAQKGETVLDFRDPRTFVEVGQERLPYLTRVVATGGYISRFETLYGGSDERTSDTEAFSRWLARLIKEGVIPQPPIHQLRRLQTVITGRINAYRDRAGVKAVYTARIARLEVDLEAVKAAIVAYGERQRGPAVPAETDDSLPPIPSAD